MLLLLLLRLVELSQLLSEECLMEGMVLEAGMVCESRLWHGSKWTKAVLEEEGVRRDIGCVVCGGSGRSVVVRAKVWNIHPLSLSDGVGILQYRYSARRTRLLMFQPLSQAAEVENVAAWKFASVCHVFAADDAHTPSQFFGSRLREALFHVLSCLTVAEKVCDAFAEVCERNE